MKKIIGTILVAGVASVFTTGSMSSAQIDQERKATMIIGFGDSTTAERGPLRVYLDCLKSDLPKNGIDVDLVNAGIGGNNTEDAKARFVKDVLDRHPDIVVIQFGINDAAVDVWQTPPATRPRIAIDKYGSNLEYFISALRKQGCKVILMTPNPMRWTPELIKLYGKPPYRTDDPDGFNLILTTYADCARTVAQENKVPLVDVYAAFQEYRKGKGQTVDDLLLDGMHPNDKGQRLVADLLIKEIMRIKGTGTAQ